MVTATPRRPGRRDGNRGNRLLSYLCGGRVCTSSELIRHLMSEGVGAVNARQIISRQSNTDGVWRSTHVRLEGGERLFAERSAVGSPVFFKNIGEKLKKTSRHGLARCVAALGTHQVLHRVNVIRLLAVSIGAESTAIGRLAHLYENELAGLRELGARIIQPDTALESIVAPGGLDVADLDAFANLGADQLRYETMLTRILGERLRRQNMLSWNRIDLPDAEKPYTLFNDQLFSAFGFSYLAPLVKWKDKSRKPTPCPVLIDCYHGVCTLAQVESFIQRVERATIRGKQRMPSLGIIAARDFDRDAWQTARHKALMTVSFRQMFGDEALDAMVQVEKLLNGLGHGTANDRQDCFKEMARLIEDLKTNPVITDLRSIGFEALCALILHTRGYQSVEMQRKVPWGNTTRDVDVYGLRDDELYIVECKAYHKRKSIIGSEVKKFFEETVPALKKWMRLNTRHFSKCKAEIWTTGPIGKDAGDTLHQLHRPKTDEWNLTRMSDMHDDIPKAIRTRSIRLLESIALTESAIDVDPEEAP